MGLQFGFVIFWQKDFGAKAAHKMLVKLTPGDKGWLVGFEPLISRSAAEWSTTMLPPLAQLNTCLKIIDYPENTLA